MSRSAGLLAACCLAGFTTLVTGADAPKKLRVYIGTFNTEDGGGIYQSELDLSTGALSDARLAGKADGTSFLGIHPSKKFIYAVSSITDADVLFRLAGVYEQLHDRTSALAWLGRRQW